MVNTFTTSVPLPQVCIDRMKQTQQNPCFHAEGDVFTHTLMVLENVLSLDDSWGLTSEERHILYWAALLHDIGKPEVTQWEAGRFHSHGHEQAGVPVARAILLGQEGVTDYQRRQILDLVRWHSIPLHFRKLSFDAYKKMAVQIDMRMLGIFAFCDLTGRICQNQEEVKELIMHFNQEIVPKLQTELGTYLEIQQKYKEASLLKKNQLWKGVKHADYSLVEQLLSSSENELPSPNNTSCIIPIGIHNDAIQKYLNIQYKDALRIKIEYKDKLHLHNAIFTSMSSYKGKLLFEGDFTQQDLRNELVKILRNKGMEIKFLFFETGLEKLSDEIEDPLQWIEIQKIYKRLYQPHPWEAHSTEYIRL